MSIPDSPRAQSLDEQSNVLRQELKLWEKAFAAANSGQKAGRADIKKDAVIASKYKTYNRLREQLKGSVCEVVSSPSRRNLQCRSQDGSPKRRRAPLDDLNPNGLHQETPRKGMRQRELATPSKSGIQSHAQTSPSTLRKLFSPTQARSPYIYRTAIGPTPQRDGKALGLFDLLSQSGGSVKSPSSWKKRTLDVHSSQDPRTPSKRARIDPKITFDAASEDEGIPRARHHSRTPASSGKLFLLSTFLNPPAALQLTPTKKRIDRSAAIDARTIDPQPECHLPQSDTPQFLRRGGAPRALYTRSTDDGGELSPVRVRMPSKLHVRGLSQLVKGLRDMEDERMDEELEMLREMEEEELGQESRPEVLVKDSQVNSFAQTIAMGGDSFDADLEPIPEEVIAEDEAKAKEQPTRIWKKKGQKRTTRRVNMKPRARQKSVAVEDVVVRDEDGAVTKTQIVAIPPEGETDQGGDGHGGSDKEEDYIDDEESTTSNPTKQSAARKQKTKKGQANAKDNETKEKPQKKQRKANPQAHMNFRALKIKNKNSKAKGRGRFGRRR